jgi:hypothetical protein
MHGYSTQANILNDQYRNQLAAYSADQDSASSVWGAAGTAAGIAMGQPWFGAAMGGITAGMSR